MVFHSGVSYRHLAVVTARDESERQTLATLECEPPHNITGQEYESWLPRGDAAGPILEWMNKSQHILRDQPANVARQRAGKLPATSIWLWGQGVAPDMKTFADKYGLSGAVVSAVDLVNGIGRCAGFEVVKVPGATGYLDTNYDGKVAATLSALDRVDVVYLHLEAPDETSHEGRLDRKIQAIEDFDSRVVAPCLARAVESGDVRILVAPDHITALSTKTHAGGPVPFVVYGPGVPASGVNGYHEKTGADSGILVGEGYALIERWLDPAPIAPLDLNAL